MSRARILHLVSTDLLYDQRVQRISASLAERYDVTVLGHEKHSSLALPDHPASRYRVSTLSRSGPRFYYEMNRAMISWAKGKSYDLVVSNDLDTLWAGRQISESAGAQLGIDAHEYFTAVPELVSKPVKRAIWTQLGKTYIPACTLRYTCTRSLAKTMTTKYGGDWGLVRNMPLLDTPVDAAAKRDQFTVIYQGAVNEGRGVELMLAALQKIPDIRLVVAGEGDLSSQMRNLAVKLGVMDRVDFMGYLVPSALRKLTAQCHVGINLLSATSANYQVSLANKFFDYVHAEIPAIHMAFPEYESMIQEYNVGILTQTYTVESLVSALHHLRDDKVRSHYQSACIRAKKLWNWQSEQERLYALYDAVL